MCATNVFNDDPFCGDADVNMCSGVSRGDECGGERFSGRTFEKKMNKVRFYIYNNFTT